MRATAGIASLTIAAASLIGFAPSTSAYEGAPGPVGKAVLSTAAMADAAGWPTSLALSGNLAMHDDHHWSRIVPPRSIPDDYALPRTTELQVMPTKKERERVWALRVNEFRDDETYTVLSRTTRRITVEYTPAAHGSTSSPVATFTVTKAGSDGLVSTSCVSSLNTTLTAAQRVGCTERVAAAQVGAWTAVAPAFDWPSRSTVRAHLLTTKQARTATRVRKGVSLKTAWTHASSSEYNGRLVKRKYRRDGNGLSYAAPSYLSVVHHGNRLNTVAPYEQAKRTAGEIEGPLYRVGRNRYTYGYTTMRSGGTTTVATTVVRVGSAIITGECVSSAGPRPSAAAVRLCSRRLVNAQAAKLRPIFGQIR